MELNSATVGNGRVAFQPEIKPTPEAKETSGKAIIVTSARPGRAASYDVTFVIDTKFACNGLEVSNVFHWEVMIPEDDHHASFRSVEDRAMKLISPMLRAVRTGSKLTFQTSLNRQDRFIPLRKAALLPAIEQDGSGLPRRASLSARHQVRQR